MKKNIRFQNSTLLALFCLTLTTLACTKSDSLGAVGGKDGGADGPGKSPIDTMPDGADCGGGRYLHYTAPGCGSQAVPICEAPKQDACAAIVWYCSCDGVTGVIGSCGTSNVPYLYEGPCKTTPDATPEPDVAPAPDGSPVPDGSPDSSCQYPEDSHVNASGDTVWSWRFHWQDVNLAATCAAWGADAKVILEVDVPANPSGSGTTLPTCALDTLSTGAGPKCAMANAWRFEAVCTDSQVLVELPSSNTFHGYYHVESTAYPNSPRHLVSQDVHCSRDLYLPTGIGSPPATTNDGGVDAAAPRTDGGAPCAACTANQVCVQSFDGTCHTTGPGCITVTDTCRTKLIASGAKSCTSLPECQSEFCTSPYQCLISPPCGTEAPQAAIYCYGP